MMLGRIGLTAVAIFLLLLSTANAQEPNGDTLTNETVIELHQLGLGAEVLIEKIRSSVCDFDVTMTGLKKLKHAGVPGEAIAEMIRAARDADAAEDAGSSDPTLMHPPGIYLYQESEGEPTLAAVEPTVYMQTKSGGFFKSAVTLGIAKTKSKATLGGDHAQLQISSRRPTFYFYFSTNQETDVGGSAIPYFEVATSANEFLLVRVKVKKRTRELIVGQVGAFSAEGGPEEKALVPFVYEKVADRIYKVVPENDLADGEYCFFYGGTVPMATYGAAYSQGGKVYDFGVGGATAAGD